MFSLPLPIGLKYKSAQFFLCFLVEWFFVITFGPEMMIKKHTKTTTKHST